MFHLTARVAWHDSRWNGSVFRQTSCNFFCAALDHIRVHLGMLSRPDYKRGWEWERAWYEKNGSIESKTLFSSTEEGGKGLDSVELKKTALVIKGLLE